MYLVLLNLTFKKKNEVKKGNHKSFEEGLLLL